MVLSYTLVNVVQFSVLNFSIARGLQKNVVFAAGQGFLLNLVCGSLQVWVKYTCC